MTLQELVYAGQCLHYSQMFGTKNQYEGFVIASICEQEKISYLKFRENYSLIYGNIGKRADAMLADFLEINGKYKIIEKTENKCVIDFEYNGEKYTSVVDFEVLKKEVFVAKNNKYATPYSRRQMLFARCVSDGLRSICPIACKGRYTPEEISDIATENGANNDAVTQIEPPPVNLPSQENKTSPDAPPSLNLPQQSQQPEMPKADDNQDVDYTICRLRQGQMFGKKWQDMTTEQLQIAYNKIPIMQDFTQADRDNIKSILDFRYQNNNIPADN